MKWKQSMGLVFLFFLLLMSCKKSTPEFHQDEVLQTIIKNNDAEVSQEEDALDLKLQKTKPIYQYYKKIPPMTGVTNDPENMIFSLQIELGYEVGEIKTLEKLSKYSIKIAGEVRQSMATKTKIYLGNQKKNYIEIENDILELINKIIAPDPNDMARVKDVIIIELLLHDYR